MVRVTLHKHIGIGFALIWAMMSAVIVLAVFRIEAISDRIDQIATEHNIKIALAVEMRDIIYQRQLVMRNSLVYGDMFERENNRARLEILAQQFVTLRDGLRSLPMNDEEQMIFRKIQDAVAASHPRGLELSDVSVFEGLNEKTRELTRKVSDTQWLVIENLNELVAYETDQINSAVLKTRESQTYTRNLILLLGAVAAALNFLIAFAVIRHSRRQTEKIELLARFPGENPRPVMRVSNGGELIYANAASRPFLLEWETELGHQVPLEWQQVITQVTGDRIVAEKQTTCGDRIYTMVITPVPEGGYVNVYGHDVTEREQIREEFAHLASHDSLTGLINRREFELVLDRTIEEAKRDGSEHAFMYIDLDQFKVVNDTCGHIAGDEMLRQLAAVLKDNVRDSDRLGRLGGDEFGLLLQFCSLGRAEKIAENLRQLVENFRFVWKNQSFNVGASIGVVSITAETGNISRVLSAADAACYIAKESGRNRVHVSHPGDEQILRRQGQMEWVQRIRDAIENNEFELYYQSIKRLSGGSAGEQHGEILLRLFDASGKPVAPEIFIQAAERYDLMTGIDRWVLREALTLLAGEMGNNDVGSSWYSINLSGQSVSEKNFLPYVVEQLEISGIDPGAICFEITETAAISNLASAMEFINALHEKGCRFALDDFGSGLSSFSYLKNLNIDYVKIDGSFVRSMHEDKVSAAMVEAITKVAHEMGIGVIAEWVEHERTIDMLRALKVEYAQGFALERPYPFVERARKAAVS